MKKFYVCRANPGITFKLASQKKPVYGFLIKSNNANCRDFPVHLDYPNYTFVRYWPEVDMAEIHSASEGRTMLIQGDTLIES